MVILNKSARAATAGLTDTATSTKAVAAVLNAYHKQAKDAGDVSDTLFETVNRGVLTFEELSNTIGDVLPFASALHVDLNQVGAATSTMTKEGINASETMTRLKNVLQAFIKPSEGMNKALKKTGFESGEALIKAKGLQGAIEAIRGTTDGSKKALAALFPNIRALGGALALTGGNAKSAHQDLKAFGDVSGATNKALSEQAKSVSYQWNKLKAQVESVAIGFGNQLLPAINKVIGVLGDKRLTGEEKLKKLGEILSRTIDRLNVGERIGQAISKATPVIAAAMAKVALTAATIFAKAFTSSNVWGKLILGGWLLSRMGGKAGFFKMGAVAGTSFGEGMAATSAVGFAGKFRGLAGGLAALGKKLLVLDVALNLVDQHGNPIAAAINTAHDLTFGIVPKVKNLSGNERAEASIKGIAEQLDRALKGGNITAIEKVRDRIKGMAAEARSFGRADLAGQLDRLATRGTGSLNRLSDAEHKAAGMSGRFADAIRGLRLKGSKDFDGLVQQVTFGSRQILKVGGEKSQQTQQAISRQFDLARKRVRQAMDDNVVTVKRGMDLLHASL